MNKRSLFTYIILFLLHTLGVAQEHVGPLYYNPSNNIKANTLEVRSQSKKTAAILTLPFFEDFSEQKYYPDTNKWADRKVYINNTMGIDPVTMGIVTLDAIDEDGLPYEKINNTVVRYADSLTSQKIDLSTYSAGDSIYFSFFYQPQGNGFDPQQPDSLMLYFRKTSGWTRVWRTEGVAQQPFKQVIIHLDQSSFFYDEFQFRFVNKASISNADDNWNIDYIRIDANRTYDDTLVNDIAFGEQPTFLLNDYTSMPYHQFLANKSGELSTNHEAYITNPTGNSVSVNYGYNTTETAGGTNIGNGNGSSTINPYSAITATFTTPTNTPASPGRNKYIAFENKYYLQSSAQTGYAGNDTIVQDQVFHNYLSYDDGSAEKSYYLKLFSTLPGKIAIEYHLNEPDTLKGIAIYFGRQVPLAYQKYFSAAVYKDIAYQGGSDQLLYQEDFLIPNYLSENRFWYYKFRNPVVLQAGTFYIGTIQPALSGSDSLYIGLDVNRKGTNHAYYNVLDNWVGSTIDGAIMIRPLFGDFFPSIVNDKPLVKNNSIGIAPNPAKDFITISLPANTRMADYNITDVNGRIVAQGTIRRNERINVENLVPGMYLVFLNDGTEKYQALKFTKTE